MNYFKQTHTYCKILSLFKKSAQYKLPHKLLHATDAAVDLGTRVTGTMKTSNPRASVMPRLQKKVR